MSRVCNLALARRVMLGVALLALALAWSAPASAQFVNQQVGGVSIDARGIVKNVQIDEFNRLKQEREQALRPVPGDLKGRSLRKISLRALETAIAEHRAGGNPLSDEMRYLAGMQRIQYVFVYPEQNDIVLAGPGEGWTLGAQGEIVGVTTGRPVLLLDDLLVALRSIEAQKRTPISCSIDPSSDGLKKLQALYKQVRTIDNDDPSELMTAVESTLGPQAITVTGVPETSHFARVLVAGDYRMKRLAMAFEASPIAGLPDFLHMIKTSGKAPKTMLPRWWLAPAYDALLSAPDGLAWELRKAGVKAMTEEEVLNAAGERQRTGQASPLAKKWADNMTNHYDELSLKEVIFGQLRNCMDLAVVAALVSKENLTEKCSWSMPLLLSPELAVEEYNAPHQVDSAASAVQKGTNWIISASGGVQIDPFQPLDKPTVSPALGELRAKAAAPGKSWWWN